MRGRIVVVAGTLLVLGAAIAMIYVIVETDEERIERVVETMRVAALDGDVPGLLEHVAPDVDYPGGREGIERQVESALRRYPPDSVNVEVLDLEIDGDRATARIEVWYRTKTLGGRPARVRFRTAFGRRGDRWQVIGVSDVER
jgi:uncharacterized protein (TIGR02246 family)